MLKRYVAVKAIAGCALLIAGCGGGSDTVQTPPPPSPTTYTIGGSLAGLPAGASVTLANNGANNTPVNANGPFTFSTAVSGAYAVTVATPPAGQTCTVANGSGTATANVTNVAVTCAATPATNRTIGGTVTGLAAGQSVVLQNNGGGNLTVNANQAFTFATPIANGATYAVSVLTQPAGQVCTVTNGAGTASANVTNVAVACATVAPGTFTVGGAVSGLAAGQSVVLQNNGAGNVSVSANGPFVFATPVVSGGAYAATVLTQPAGQTCSVTNGSGTVSANVANVTVTCVNVAPATFTIGGNVTGLAANRSVVLQNNGAGNLTVAAPGAFTFTAPVNSGAAYAVTVATQPVGQICTPTVASGTASANVTTVVVTCAASESVAPTVAEATPLPRANGSRVSGGVVTVKFSEQMDTATVTTSTLKVTAAGSSTPVAGTVTMTTGDTVAVFTPTTRLAFDTSYTAELSAGAKDLAGNAVAARTWSFNSGKMMAVGDFHTCARRIDGRVQCWGDNQWGQLGYGDFVSRGDGTGVQATVASLGNVDLGVGRVAVALSASDYNTCAILDDASLTCWGRNQFGQLARGNTADSGTPGSVDLGVGLKALEVSVGQDFMCARLDDNSVKCWGDNARGQLGRENSAPIGRTTVGEVAQASGINFGVAAGTVPVQISTGHYHACAVFEASSNARSVKCWGANNWGQVGLTTNTGDFAVGDSPGEMTSLTDVALGAETVYLQANGGHTCALLTGGSVKCWGLNTWGQVGLNTFNGLASSALDSQRQSCASGTEACIGDATGEVAASASALAPTSASRIAVGYRSNCALRPDNTVKCWGSNQQAQLGVGLAGIGSDAIRGDEAGEMASTVMESSLMKPLRTIEEISAGGYQTCVVGTDLGVNCWGDNTYGQIGRGDKTPVAPIGDAPSEMGDGLTDIVFNP